MTSQIVLNSFKWGIKHTDGLSAPCFTSKDFPFKNDTTVLPVVTESELFKLYNSAK